MWLVEVGLDSQRILSVHLQCSVELLPCVTPRERGHLFANSSRSALEYLLANSPMSPSDIQHRQLHRPCPQLLLLILNGHCA